MNDYERNCPPDDVHRLLGLRRAQMVELQETITHLEALADLDHLARGLKDL